MNQVVFERIRGNLPNGQRGAFEELVCQLARRECPTPASFKRIEGSGGDGGVECLHDSDSGRVGYQAKFYTNARDIDWRGIDRSVRTALTLHPGLVRYIIAVPCDFTGRRRSGRGRVSDGTWGMWDEYVRKWSSLATEEGRSVEFVPWTAAELRARLTPNNADGLRTYWFSDVEFSAEWFRHHVETAVASLDERYNPQDHVDVRVQHMFDVLAKHPRAIAVLEQRFSAVRRATLPRFSGNLQPPHGLLIASAQALEKVVQCEIDLRRPAWQQWDSVKWLSAIALAQDRISELRSWCSEQQSPGLDYEIHRLSSIQDALASLESAIDGSFTSAEMKRLALLSGTAGGGKSHLLAWAAETAIAEGRPVVFWLGQQLRDQALWPQLLERFGLSTASSDQLLGALEAAAAVAGTRALILVDALNEGPGARLWRSEIAGFVRQVQRYPSLAVVLACRSEYIDYLMPPALLQDLPRIEVRGFETAEEQAVAARVYLDKRGISRPATPWLAPEFVNPLFLRSCCIALQREGRREFPRGLTGTKAILSFYLESVARHLGAGRDGSEDLVGPTKRCVTHLAGIMAANRRNYAPLEAATEAAAESFRPYTPPENLTWLDVLRRNGLLRLDPDPEVKRTGPLEAPLDVVRFSFQRFQDHLMADALLSSVSDVEAAMAEGGSLAFIRTEARFRWEWRGSIEALSIQIPERTGREFVDTLPGGARRWWSTYFAQEAFLESLRWRSADAFTDRTLELFNRLFGNAPEALSLLIELSASIDHPWNADLIHRNLKSLPMHQRDAFWTAQLNMECNDEQHSVHRLIDWCLRPETVWADPRTIRLCALTTAWLFTLSNRPVRDQATKALARLLIGHPSILSELVQAFRGVDDLYVWERIFGAAFGAACNDPVPSRVGDYARIAAETLFLRADVPENLLLRDYGRGLVQLGEHLRVLTPDIAWERCHPPYGSRALRLTATRAQVEALAEKAGDKAILHSCDKWGDFGRYEIGSGLGDFTADRLTRPAPITAHGRFNAFERDVVTVAGDRRMAWDGMRSVVASGFRIRLAGSTAPEPTPDEELRWQEAVRTAERTFEALLTPDERRRYRRDARGYLGLGKSRGRRDHRRIDVERAQLWVARRAYELGRADKRFPWSQRSMAWDRGRPRVERLGKKYQWISLDELVCRLADNNWVSDYGDDAIRYEYPPDIGIFRDIDPTIVVQEPQASAPQWMTTPRIVVEPDQSDRLAWPFAADRESELERLIIRTETGGRGWLTAYEHQWASERRNKTAEHSFEPYGRQEFRFVCLVLVHEGDHDQLVHSLQRARELDIHSWDPPEFTDRPYLLEATWRPIWSSETWLNDPWGGRTVPVAFPISEYIWESHLDLSLNDGHRELLPSPWLMRALRLSRRREGGGTYDDSSGVPRMLQGSSGRDGTVALLDRDWFATFLQRESLQCVWLYLNERSSLLGDRQGAWRRTEGVAWIDRDTVRTLTWRDDQTRLE